MMTQDLLMELFCQRLDELGKTNNLTSEETERIKTVFRQSLSNKYMNEQDIYRKLTAQEPLG